MKQLFLFFLVALSLFAGRAEARVPVETKAIMTMSFPASTEFGDGYRAGMNSWSEAEAEADAAKHIADGAKAGVSVFLLDYATTNSDAHLWRTVRWNKAAREYNKANPTKKICIAPMYESATGAAAMFDAADAGGAESPLCTMNASGQKPVIATWGNNACINPIPQLSGRGPFVMVGTVYNNGINIADKACVDTWKNAGASDVYSYYWMSGNANAITGLPSKVTDIIATGAKPVVGIGTAHTRGCGDGGYARKTDNYELHDFNYWAVWLRTWIYALGNNIPHVMYTMGYPGDTGEGSYRGGSVVCEARDGATHNATIGGINHGFTCPAVPDDLKAAIPSGFVRSTSLPLWTHKGFQFGEENIFSKWFKTGTEPGIDKPVILFAYRQYDAMTKLSGMQICPNAEVRLSNSSLGAKYWGHKIAVTSWGPATRLRVRIGSETLFDGTLPEKQMKRTAGDERQTVIDIGTRQGRPTFEVLDSSGKVIASKEGLLKMTNAPKHWGGLTGMNQGLYADGFAYSQTDATQYTIEALDGVVQRGTAGTKQRIKIKRLGDTSKKGTVRFNSFGVGTVPAEGSDFSPSGLPSGQVTFSGDEPLPTGQCAEAPPAIAAAEGLTKLAFCDDFSTDTVARDTNPTQVDKNVRVEARAITGNKKWTTERASYSWGGIPDPASSFTFNSDGTLTVKPVRGTYNWFMSSTYDNRDGTLAGYWLKKKPKWYMEIRWKFAKGTAAGDKQGVDRQPGFWSMDACHLYGVPARCPGPKRDYVEPDTWEYPIDPSMGLHYYEELGDPQQGQLSCGGWGLTKAKAPGDNIFFTAGLLFTGDSQVFTLNGTGYYTRKAADTCYLPSGSKWTGRKDAGFIFGKMLNGDYPILVGSKKGEIITIDYVRVWEAP